MFSSKVLYWASRPVVGTYTDTMLDMDVRLHADLPRGPKIIAVNHPSTTDPFFIASVIQQQSFILIKDVLFQVPVFGTYLRRLGHIPVCAGCGQKAVDAAVARLQEGRTIVIFPEGDLSPAEGGFLPARTGVARIALATGAPIIPVGIHLQRDRIHNTTSTVNGQVEYARWYLRGPYNITIGHAMNFRGDVENRPYVHWVAEQVMNRIAKLAQESENRMDRSFTPLPTFSEAL